MSVQQGIQQILFLSFSIKRLYNLAKDKKVLVTRKDAANDDKLVEKCGCTLQRERSARVCHKMFLYIFFG